MILHQDTAVSRAKNTIENVYGKKLGPGWNRSQGGDELPSVYLRNETLPPFQLYFVIDMFSDNYYIKHELNMLEYFINIDDFLSIYLQLHFCCLKY